MQTHTRNAIFFSFFAFFAASPVCTSPLKSYPTLSSACSINRDYFITIPESAYVDGLENATSAATSEVTGWFVVRVLGTGSACYIRENAFGVRSNSEQYGEFASTEAFVSFYGQPECEAGDVGFAWGFIRAYVVAQAYEKGDECLARVISAVIDDPFGQYSQFYFGDVDIKISGESAGEALALCV